MKISDARNVHKPITIMVEFECEEKRQFELTPDALVLLEDNGFLPEVDDKLALTRPKWKEALQKERLERAKGGSLWTLG